MREQLTISEAYRAMFRFLEAHYDRTKADEIGALLGGMATDDDGQPLDPAAWSDWLEAVRVTIEGAPGPDASGSIERR